MIQVATRSARTASQLRDSDDIWDGARTIELAHCMAIAVQHQPAPNSSFTAAPLHTLTQYTF